MKRLTLERFQHFSCLWLINLFLLSCCMSSTNAVSNDIKRSIDLALKHGSDHSKHSQMVGQLEVALEYSYPTNHGNEKVHFRQNSVAIGDVTSLKVCLASAGYEGWIVNGCVETQNINSNNVHVNLRKFSVVRFHLTKTVKNSHLLVVKSSNDEDEHGDDVLAWSELPESGNAAEQVTLTSPDRPIKGQVTATVLLSCAPNHFGPQCGIECVPPSSRHRCGRLNGELKCAPGWTGRDCENQVFISLEEASLFIKHRSKRKNSWHRAEEFQGGNVERECNEEKCSREEAREAFEDDALTAGFWRAYTDPNQCKPRPCVSANSVRCEDLIGDYSCHCKNGYHGKNCQYENDVCASGPCRNGAFCQKHSVTSHSCICPAGFRGLACEVNIDDCVKSNCGAFGACVDGVNNFTCVCANGFTGRTCNVNIDDCENNPCQNGGNCTDHVGFYSCKCPEEYDGKDCEHRINPCFKRPCMNDGACSANEDYSFTCSCQPQYTGDVCQYKVGSVCASEPCSNGGMCFVNQTNLVEMMGSNGNLSQEFTCICPIGYRGDTCDDIISPCELEPDDLCPFNSTCLGLNRQYLCVCPEGYTGDFCQLPGNGSEALERLGCQDNPCLNEARCLHHDNETTCLCRAGFNGTRCENKVNFCSSIPCANNGECIPAPNGFYCNCATGYSGRFCQLDIDECSREDSLCQHNGTCVNLDGSFQCVCRPYFTGRYCESPFDPCNLVPCANGGTCSHENNIKGYTCACTAGYGGNDCNDIINPCTDVTNPCENNAKCSPNPELTSKAVCACPAGYYGPTCAKEIDNCAVTSNFTVNLNGEIVTQLVERSDCGVNGYCNSTEDGFECSCRKGFTGDRCETEYTLPFIQCPSETCVCPIKLLNEVLYHGENNSVLNCQYRHYDKGVCKKVTCITPSCPSDQEQYQCAWNSKCLQEFVSGVPGSNQLNSTDLCPVIEVIVDLNKFNEGTTVEDFCRKVRELPSYSGLSDHATIHCSSYNINDNNGTIAVAIDSVTSRAQAVLLAYNIFQRLEEEQTNASSAGVNTLAEDLDPMFAAIISLRFGGSLSHVQKPNDERPRPTLPSVAAQSGGGFNLLYVLIPIILALVLVVFIVFVVCRRRRLGKDLQVLFVANPNNQSDDSNSEEPMVAPPGSSNSTPVKKSNLQYDLVNPLLADEKHTYTALTSRPAALSNPYVASPYAVSPTFSIHSSSSGGSQGQSVEEKTVDFGVDRKSSRRPISYQYEDMNGLTLPHDSRLPSTTSECTYDFAKDLLVSKKSHHSRGSPRMRKHENRMSSAYEEIDVKQLPPQNENPYETVDIVPRASSSKTPHNASSDAKKKSTVAYHEQYDFATQVPDIGVPSPHLPRRSTKLSDAKEEKINANKRCDSDPPSVTPSSEDSGIDFVTTSENVSPETTIDETGELPDETYQTPSAAFPKHDDLFFPEDGAGTADVYAVPRLANPVDEKH